jgi:Na+/H+ antiporter NhaD/arsenite permease-like protein
VAILAVALVLIATEWVHHTKIALLGAGLVVVTQTIEQEQAIEAIDFNTIGLLAGMMLMVKLTETTGVYTYHREPHER